MRSRLAAPSSELKIGNYETKTCTPYSCRSSREMLYDFDNYFTTRLNIRLQLEDAGTHKSAKSPRQHYSIINDHRNLGMIVTLVLLYNASLIWDPPRFLWGKKFPCDHHIGTHPHILNYWWRCCWLHWWCYTKWRHRHSNLWLRYDLHVITAWCNCAKLTGEDLSRYLIKIESVVLRKA